MSIGSAPCVSRNFFISSLSVITGASVFGTRGGGGAFVEQFVAGREFPPVTDVP